MSEEHPPSSPTDPSPGSTPPGSAIPPVEPIVVDDTPADGIDTTAPVAEPTPIAVEEPTPVTVVAPAEQPSSHMLLPKWLVFTVVGVALACLGFGAGWIARSGSDSNDGSAASSLELPDDNLFGDNGGNGQNGNGGNGGNGNGGLRLDGAFLGVSARATTGDADGAVVAEVVDGSPADDAGLATGDVITKVDDETIDDPAQLVEEIGDRDPGDDVTVTYTRDSETTTADVTLGDRGDQIPSFGTRPGSED